MTPCVQTRSHVQDHGCAKGIYGLEILCFPQSHHIPRGAHAHLQQQKASKGAPSPALNRTHAMSPGGGTVLFFAASPDFPREDGGHTTGIAFLPSAQSRPDFCHPNETVHRMFPLLLKMKVSVPHLTSPANEDGWSEARPAVQILHMEGSALAKQPCPTDLPGCLWMGMGFLILRFWSCNSPEALQVHLGIHAGQGEQLQLCVVI